MSEVFNWLKAISSGLNLERLSKDFEDKGFRTISSLKYLQTTDLDVLFPSPQKLTLAERRIIQHELDTVKNAPAPQALRPRELFLPVNVPQQCVSQANNCVFSSALTLGAATNQQGKIPQRQPLKQQDNQQSSQASNSYLGKRESELKQDSEVLQAKILSLKDLLEKKIHDYDNYIGNNSSRQKTCSECHTGGHTKAKCSRGPCQGISQCKNRDKHPEVKAEIQDLKKVIKDMEKKNEKSKNEYDVFKAARERAANGFFAIMRPRLRKQNHIKYVDRSALDKDLLILKKALGNKIPLDERLDWELPYIIERYQRANVDIYKL